MRRRNFSLCRSVPWARMVAAAKVRMPALATPTAPMRWNSSSTTALKATGRSRPYHCLGQCGTPQPDSASLLRHSTSPSSGFQLASSHARTSARTELSVGSSIARPLLVLPVLHHQLAMLVGIAKQDLRAFGALEPEMRVVVPGEADAAMHLHGVNRGLQIGFGGAGLWSRGGGGPGVFPFVAAGAGMVGRAGAGGKEEDERGGGAGGEKGLGAV